MEYKKFKDPVYGYISIPKEVVTQIIDSAEFQRLRFIRQTSYQPLYSAALHNRFIHSLGVYHLGTKVFNAIKLSSDLDECNIDDLERIFSLSCLLHDVGHAPFSHSGEEFYLKNNGDFEKEDLYLQLREQVNNESFTRDMQIYHQKKKPAAPHEIMSVIVAIKRFPNYFTDSEMRSFFARCITGYKYSEVETKEISIFNVFISLLNSSTIDVDKLDYLIRDAFVTGYDSIAIDYDRLLGSATLQETNGKCYFAYNKTALSVIENVIYAHDAEKKWIQSHPVILYEHFLVQHIIRKVNNDFKQKNGQELFCLESLLENGNEDKISLLCDDDIIHWAKSIDNKFCKEFFNRSLRRHPIWKSEAEYRVIVDGLLGEDVFPKLEAQLKILESFLLEESISQCIDEQSKSKCLTLLNEIDVDDELSNKDKETMKERYNIVLNWLTCFENIHTSQNVPFDFVLVQTYNFKSGFLKQDLADINVYFSNIKKDFKLGKLITLLSASQKSVMRERFFYLYYKREEKDIDPVKVGKEIAKIVI